MSGVLVDVLCVAVEKKDGASDLQVISDIRKCLDEFEQENQITDILKVENVGAFAGKEFDTGVNSIFNIHISRNGRLRIGCATFDKISQFKSGYYRLLATQYLQNYTSYV